MTSVDSAHCPQMSPGDGRCRLGLFGGRPSPGICAEACTREPGAWRQLLRSGIAAGSPPEFGAAVSGSGAGRRVLAGGPRNKNSGGEGGGPGTRLRCLLAELGITEVVAPATGQKACGCRQLAAQMDRWGVQGCQQHRVEIIGRMMAHAKQYGWSDKLGAGVLAAVKMPGLLLAAVRGMDATIGWLVDEALGQSGEDGEIAAFPCED